MRSKVARSADSAQDAAFGSLRFACSSSAETSELSASANQYRLLPAARLIVGAFGTCDFFDASRMPLEACIQRTGNQKCMSLATLPPVTPALPVRDRNHPLATVTPAITNGVEE